MKNTFSIYQFLVILKLIAINNLSHAQLVAIEFDTVAVHAGTYSDGVDLTGYVTYRMYAVCQEPENVVMRVSGNWMNDTYTYISSSTGFWQSSIGSSSASEINCNQLLSNPSLAFDSWISINCAADCSCEDVVITDGWQGNWVDNFEDGGYIYIWTNWEGWSGDYMLATADSSQGTAGSELRILLGQFTTQSHICGRVTVEMYEQGIGMSDAAYQMKCACSDDNIIQGCMNADACNYNPLATWDNCTCLLSGCIDPLACNYEPNAGCDDGSCTYGVVGCMIEGSCNYDPLATCGDPSLCLTLGCTNPDACNYQSYADCDDGSCNLGDQPQGYVFYDPTPNNQNDNWNFLSMGMANIPVNLQPVDITVFTNNIGYFQFPELPAGDYSIQVGLPDNEWIYSEDGYSEFEIPNCSLYSYGLAPAGDSSYAVVFPSNVFDGNIHCTNGFNPGIWLHNTGNNPMDGIFTITCDPMFVISELSNPLATAPDDTSNGVITWNIPTLLPGEQILLQCHVEGPGVDYVGQTFDFDYAISLFDDADVNFIDEVWVSTHTVSCGYDPNDKQAIPEGYAEPHFILADDEIEYRIRFQNTGNAEAVNIVIEDTLDVAHLDLTTFYPVFASHNYSTVIDTDGHVQFIFNNINLPDSASDEPGSQGYVVYRIKPLPTLQGWDEIHNTAYIYFDGNEPVVTNTTTHTIYDCAWLNELPEYDNTCIGTYQTLDFTGDYIDSYVWTLDGTEQAGNTGTIPIEFAEVGEFTLGLTLSNPLCSVSSEMPLTVHSFPDFGITVDGTELTANDDGPYYQWYHNDLPVLDATAQTFTPLDPFLKDGGYWCLITNEFGCETESEWVYFVNLSEELLQHVHLYPNPMEEYATLQLSSGNWKVEMFNSLGQKLNEWNNVQNTLQITNENLSSGAYMVRVMNEQGISGEVMMVVR